MSCVESVCDHSCCGILASGDGAAGTSFSFSCSRVHCVCILCALLSRSCMQWWSRYTTSLYTSTCMPPLHESAHNQLEVHRPSSSCQAGCLRERELAQLAMAVSLPCPRTGGGHEADDEGYVCAHSLYPPPLSSLSFNSHASSLLSYLVSLFRSLPCISMCMRVCQCACHPLLEIRDGRRLLLLLLTVHSDSSPTTQGEVQEETSRKRQKNFHFSTP